jgi:multiple sugar transport system permease protein
VGKQPPGGIKPVISAQLPSKTAILLRSIKKNLWIYLVLIPPFTLLMIFTLIPIVQSFLLSFQKWSFQGVTWTGLINFFHLLKDAVFFKALQNTFIYTAVVVPVGLAIALVLADLIMPQPQAVQTFFKSAFYLPAVVAAVVLVLIWRWIFNANNFGLLNYLLSMFNQDPVLWLQGSKHALSSLIAMALVGGQGGSVVFILAAMGGIPIHLYESARLDGSTRFKEFWYITLPLLTPTLLYLSVMGTIGSFQVFTSIYLLTNGGPNYATTTSVFYIYKTGFQNFEFGYASIQAVVLFLIIMGFSALLFRMLSEDFEY